MASILRDVHGEGYNSESTESEDSDQSELWADDGDEEIFLIGNIVPFSFEPTYSEEELHERLARVTAETEGSFYSHMSILIQKV